MTFFRKKILLKRAIFLRAYVTANNCKWLKNAVKLAHWKALRGYLKNFLLLKRATFVRADVTIKVKQTREKARERLTYYPVTLHPMYYSEPLKNSDKNVMRQYRN
jgi:hypothetical protein